VISKVSPISGGVNTPSRLLEDLFLINLQLNLTNVIQPKGSISCASFWLDFATKYPIRRAKGRPPPPLNTFQEIGMRAHYKATEDITSK
jgi:hypothetical protein